MDTRIGRTLPCLYQYASWLSKNKVLSAVPYNFLLFQWLVERNDVK